MATEYFEREPLDRLLDVTARVMRAEAELPVLVRNIPRMGHDEIVHEIEQYHSAVIAVHATLKDVNGWVQAMERQLSNRRGRPR